ncbi:MAG: hypothetical protein LBM04_13930, partial [Opitutaceae bacterium]|nr:hypothetical protein [Opitutaceae bacterium]
AAKPALPAARHRVLVFFRTGRGFASSAGLAACATHAPRNISSKFQTDITQPKGCRTQKARMRSFTIHHPPSNKPETRD